MKSWGLARIVIRGVWRIIIMAEGRMAIARVALNMVGGGRGVESGEAWWCWMYNHYRHRSFTPASLARMFEKMGFEVLSIVGKTVIPVRTNKKLLGTEGSIERLLALEAELSKDPASAGRAGHLQITARRV